MDAKKIALLEQGPFPNHFDPWLEKGHYFHQFHGHIITNLFNALRGDVLNLGYILGRETSIQVGQSQPDLFVNQSKLSPLKTRNYDAAVLDLQFDLGITFQAEREIELDRLFIKSPKTNRLVTVLELISPSNKSEDSKIINYQNRRQILLEAAVDVVEIDLSRSFKHLIKDEIARKYPYHIAIHLYDAFSRFWGMNLQDPLKSLALPVEDKVIPIDLNHIYRQSYGEMTIAYQMLSDGHYTIENLPFPTTLSDDEREKLLAAVNVWQEAVQAS
jgi:hypothetical protein